MKYCSDSLTTWLTGFTGNVIDRGTITIMQVIWVQMY